MLQELSLPKFLYRFFVIALFAVLVIGGGFKVQAQTTEEDEEEEEILFVDTIEINKIQLIEEEQESQEITDDSLQNAAHDYLDSLAQAEFRLYIPKTPMHLLEDRLACIEREIPLTLNRRVAGFIDYFVVRNRNYTQTMLERKDVYFPLFEKYLKQYGLPDELKYLAIVESGLNHAAISRSAAVGLWQFMSFTGKDMKLHQDYYIDERMHPELSTIAACRYLKMLYNVFHDWELVLASYNCGLGKIMRVQRQTGKKKFWEMYEALPQETRAYVPQFVAVTYAMNYAEAHNIFPDADSMLIVPSKRDTLEINAALDLNKFSRVIGADHKTIKILNPELRRGITPHNRAYTLTIPAEFKAVAVAKRQAIIDSCYIPTDEAELAYRNPVLVKRKSNYAQAKVSKTEEGLEKISHRVHKGETYHTIASKYNVKVVAIKRWNKQGKKHKLKAGEKLIIYRDKESQVQLASIEKKQTKEEAEKSAEVKSLSNEKLKQEAKPKNTIDSQIVKKVLEPKLNGEQAKVNYKQEALALEESPKESQKKSKAKKSEEKNEKTNAEKQIIYEVQPGDTLYKISRKFSGTSIPQLMKLNDLKEGKITVGQKLIIG